MVRFYESLQMPGGSRVRVSYGCLGGIVIAVFWTAAWLVYGALWLVWQLARGLVLGAVWLVREARRGPAIGARAPGAGPAGSGAPAQTVTRPGRPA